LLQNKLPANFFDSSTQDATLLINGEAGAGVGKLAGAGSNADVFPLTGPATI